MDKSADPIMALEDCEDQQSFTSEFVPLETPLGKAIKYHTIIAEAIWNNFESSNRRDLKSIPVSRESGEPGPVFDYGILGKMIDKANDKLPQYVRNLFWELAEARVCYFSTYEVYFNEQRGRDDIYAERMIIYLRSQHILANPLLYKEDALVESRRARARNNRDCFRVRRRMEVLINEVVECALDFLRIKEITAPLVQRLLQAFQEIRRQHHLRRVQKARVASVAAGAPGNNNDVSYQGYVFPRPPSTFTGPRLPQDENDGRANAVGPAVDGIIHLPQ